MDGCSSQQCSISHRELRPRNLAAQDPQLMPEHEEFDVFHVQAAPATNQRTQQSSDGEVEEGEGHAADPPNPLTPPRRHRYWHPSRLSSDTSQGRYLAMSTVAVWSSVSPTGRCSRFRAR